MSKSYKNDSINRSDSIRKYTSDGNINGDIINGGNINGGNINGGIINGDNINGGNINGGNINGGKGYGCNNGNRNDVRNIIDNAIDKYYNINKDYYNDVLIFLNLIFKQNVKSIMSIYIKKIVLHEDIMIMYNDIVKKYKLNKDYINIDAFDVDEIIDIDLIIKLMKLLTNNLLEKLNYKLVEKCTNNKKKFTIIFNGGF